ncbi:MAG: serine/threonine-protein kinase [Polyangiaceae bacterium]
MDLPLRIGRYSLYRELARGGMATIFLGQLQGPVGFARTVAIKRLHPHLAKDPEFVTMFMDEARLAARIQHPNVASMLDVVATKGELFLVMEYIQGETLSRLLKLCKGPAPLEIVSSMLAGVLHGLHAAHEATDERGQLMNLVHRDVSPQNVMVGRDGATRLLDFGVARAQGRFHTTEEGKLKGKLPYMAPEQLRGAKPTRQTDIYAAAAVLWESLTGRRLIEGANEGEVLERVLNAQHVRPSHLNPRVPGALDEIVLRGLSRNVDRRFKTARDMAMELERVVPPAAAAIVGEWVQHTAKDTLEKRSQLVAELEQASSSKHDLGELMSELANYTSAPKIPVTASAVEPEQGPHTDPKWEEYVPEKNAEPKRKTWPLVLGGSIGAIGIAALVLARCAAAPADATQAAAGSGTVAASAPPSAEPPPLVSLGLPPTAAPKPTVEDLDRSGPSDTDRLVASAPAKSASAKPKWVAPPAAKPNKPDCSQPKILGKNGKWIYRRECLNE